MCNRFRQNVITLAATIALSGCGGGGGGDSAPTSILPPASNLAPLLSGAMPTTAVVGMNYKFIPNASDPEGDALTFSATNLPGWMTLNNQTGEIDGMPTVADIGDYQGIVISVTDGQSTSALPDVAVRVSANQVPLITNTPASSVIAGELFTFTPVVQDDEGSEHTFEIVNLPSWATFSATTGQLQGTPAGSDIGVFSGITITALDGVNSGTLGPFSIAVNAAGANLPPTISGSPALAMTAGTAYSFVPTGFDPEGAALTFSIRNMPAWASFDASTGAMTGTPAASLQGQFSNIVISASDGVSTVSLPAFSITVLPSGDQNTPPTISGTPVNSVAVGEVYEFTPQASDADGDALFFSISNRPAWASFNASTGQLFGGPQSGEAAEYTNIQISVSDGVSITPLAPFAITVIDNSTPVISGVPLTSIEAGEVYSFLPVSTDDENDELTFYIQNLPTWAQFSSSTGALTGTPSAAQSGTYGNIIISVTDGQNVASLAPFSITVGVNQAPTIMGTPATSVRIGSPYSFVPTAADEDDEDVLSFTAVNLPAWVDFDATSGALSGTPAVGDEGFYNNIQITVTDGAASATLAPFSIEVSELGRPVISGTPITVANVGVNYQFIPTASDPDGDTITFSIVNRPTWASFNSSTGELSGVPSVDDIGVNSTIVIRASDGQSTGALPPFDIVVSGSGVPSISGVAPTTIEAGESYLFTPTASDPEGDTLTFSISGKPNWLAFDSATGTLSGVPAASDEGVYSNVVITVSDGTNEASLAAFSITVNSNEAPTISGTPPAEIGVGESYSFTPIAEDADGDELSFVIINRPAWATFVNSTGTLTGTPSASDAGVYENIVIVVLDGQSSAGLSAFSITVTANSAPVISGVPQTSVLVGETYRFAPTASDADSDSLTFAISNRPAWATFDSTTGALTGVPSQSDIGQYASIRISVTDGQQQVWLPSFAISVKSANSAPVIGGEPPGTVAVGANYSFVPTASDADDDTLTFSISGLPAWAAFSSSTGELSGTPGSSDVGDHTGIVISVSDSEEVVALPAFAITVTSSNSAPVISGTPTTSIEAGEGYSFTPTASDADDDTLSFSIDSKPSWADFSATTGTLSGTPTAADAGEHAGIVISVSDGQEEASLPAFSIIVTSNQAPEISGSPATMVTVDTPYSFTPTATDADGDDLTFSVANLPAWANFDVATGQLSGTPDAMDVGTTDNIVVSVSDGQETVSLQAFSITVADVVTGSATLTWTPPTQYESGAPLNDLAGYRIYYGTTSGNYTTVEDIDVGGVTSYVVENLAPGTYYFAVKVVNSTGVESVLSAEVSATISSN